MLEVLAAARWSMLPGTSERKAGSKGRSVGTHRKKFCIVPAHWTAEEFQLHSCTDKSHWHLPADQVRGAEQTGILKLAFAIPCGRKSVLQVYKYLREPSLRDFSGRMSPSISGAKRGRGRYFSELDRFSSGAPVARQQFAFWSLLDRGRKSKQARHGSGMEWMEAWLRRPTFLLLLANVCSLRNSPVYRLPNGQDAIKNFISFFGDIRANKLGKREIESYAENRSKSANPVRVRQEVRLLHAVKERGNFMLASRRATLLRKKYRFVPMFDL